MPTTASNDGESSKDLLWVTGVTLAASRESWKRLLALPTILIPGNETFHAKTRIVLNHLGWLVASSQGRP